MAVMTPPDRLKWPETPQPRPGYIKKYISGNIDLAHSSPRQLPGEKKIDSYNHKTTIWVSH